MVAAADDSTQRAQQSGRTFGDTEALDEILDDDLRHWESSKRRLRKRMENIQCTGLGGGGANHGARHF